MSAPDPSRIIEDASQAVSSVLADGRQGDVPEEAVQRLLTVATKLYAARRSGSDRSFAPFLADAVTATEAAITMSAMLEAVNLELFDLELWHSFGRV